MTLNFHSLNPPLGYSFTLVEQLWKMVDANKKEALCSRKDPTTLGSHLTFLIKGPSDVYSF